MQGRHNAQRICSTYVVSLFVFCVPGLYIWFACLHLDKVRLSSNFGALVKWNTHLLPLPLIQSQNKINSGTMCAQTVLVSALAKGIAEW